MNRSLSAMPGAIALDRRVPVRDRRRLPLAHYLRRIGQLVPRSDPWRVALLAAALSVAAYVWYSTNGLTLLFNDARLSEMIGRRVVSGTTPGLAQLGTTWLPLRFLAMVPLIWNDVLFRSGIAGSLPSMAAYVIAAVFAYRIGHLLTASRTAGWVAAAVLLLNPSLLYMQSTAMSETASIAAFMGSIFYALRATRTHHPADIVKCAAAVAIGTLLRYENWFLGVLLVPFLTYAGWRIRGYALAEAWTVLFGLLAFAGCAAWVIYNAVIFHDPLLSFFYGNASHTFYPGEVLPARNQPILALMSYGYSVVGTTGILLSVLAVVGAVVFISRARLHFDSLPAYLLLAPFAFYWLVLYRGVNTLTMPELGTGPYYQIRFGLLMLPAVAICLAFLTAGLMGLRRRYFLLVPTVVIAVSVAGSTLDTPYVLREALLGPGGAASARVGDAPGAATFLANQYDGGRILISHVDTADNSASKTVTQQIIFPLLVDHEIRDRALITDANGQLFAEALAHPERKVRWIVLTFDATGHEAGWPTLRDRQDWRRSFALRWRLATTDFGTTEIYERVITKPAELRAWREQA